MYSLTSATRRGRERKHRPSPDLREDETFPPFSQVKKSEIQSGVTEIVTELLSW